MAIRPEFKVLGEDRGNINGKVKPQPPRLTSRELDLLLRMLKTASCPVPEIQHCYAMVVKLQSLHEFTIEQEKEDAKSAAIKAALEEQNKVGAQ